MAAPNLYKRYCLGNCDGKLEADKDGSKTSRAFSCNKALMLSPVGVVAVILVIIAHVVPIPPLSPRPSG